MNEWEPTHRLDDGGLYRFESTGFLRRPEPEDGWVPAVRYSNRMREEFYCTETRWFARFIPL